MIAALALVSVGVTVVGNDYRFVQAPIQIPVGPGQLEGVLTTPRDGDARRGPGGHGARGRRCPSKPRRVVLAVVRRRGGRGLRDAVVEQAWDRRTTGNRLDQSMVDRANEVAAVVDWARRQPGVPTEKIVLWGASQAGWVLPKVVAERDAH